MQGLLVTGTDTEIGKTCVSAGLVHALQAQGWRVAPFKPLAAGQQRDADGAWFNEDVRHLYTAQTLGLSEAEIGPFQWREACAPHIAAAHEGRPVDREAVLAAARALAARADLLVVEGVGGFRVPLLPHWDTADLAVDLGLPVLLVVGLRLGCLNHAALTAEAVRARGLRLAGWVANSVDPAFAHFDDNLRALRATLQAPCWGHVPRLADPTPGAVARHLTLDHAPAWPSTRSPTHV
jgi:dethiobiotin synthetase